MPNSGKRGRLFLQGWPSLHTCLLCCGLMLFLPGPSTTWAEPADLATLLVQARQQDLWHTPAWLRLLHYDLRSKPQRSRIDRGAFFLAADGDSNPVAEGEATLAGLLRPPDPQQPDTHMRCRFPARTALLVQTLGLEKLSPENLSCPALESWLHSMDASGVALAFPVAYLNNPASLFGHTLLRIDAAAFSQAHGLLSASIGFSAVTGGADKGFRYAFNGIFGGYNGRFVTRPYYQQVQEYGAIENRDIWEYPLALSAQEIDQLLRHAWELQQADFDYFFFDENCSFQIMALLEAVLPDLMATDQGYAPWVIPLDSLRTILSQRGHPGRIAYYRPSRRTRIEAASLQLKPRAAQLAHDLAQAQVIWRSEATTGYTDTEIAAILDLAIEYRLYLLEAESGQEQPEDPLLEHLLLERSRLTSVSPVLQITPPILHPDQGHASSRWHTGLGIGQDGPFLQWGFRPALHDRFDPPGGYEPGAELGFLATEFRFLPETGQLQLQSLDIVDIVSLPRPSSFFPAFAWTAYAGLERLAWNDHREKLAGQGRAGWGYRLGSDSLYGYMLAGGSFLLSDQVANGIDAGPWAELGLKAAMTDTLVIGALGRTTSYLFDLQAPIHEAKLTGALSLDRANSLRMTVSFNQVDSHASASVVFGWHRYFSL